MTPLVVSSVLTAVTFDLGELAADGGFSVVVVVVVVFSAERKVLDNFMNNNEL